MEWIYLLVAGILEVTWAVFMKMTDGFTKAVPSIITGIAYVASAVFLALALRKLPLGTAYAMWTGFGILGTTLLGVMLFKETITLLEPGDNSHSESGEKSHSESSNKNQSPGLCLLN